MHDAGVKLRVTARWRTVQPILDEQGRRIGAHVEREWDLRRQEDGAWLCIETGFRTRREARLRRRELLGLEVHGQ